MKKWYFTSLLALLLLPLFGICGSAAGLHVSAGLPNYPLIIACVVGGSLAVFLIALFAMKYRRKGADNAKSENTEEENNG